MAPLALKGLVDRLAAPGGLQGPASGIAGLVGLYVAALLFQRLCEQVLTFAYSRGEQRLVRRFGGQAYAHILTLPLGFHLDNKPGVLAQSLSEGILGLRLLLTHAAVTIAPVIA